ncbi:MAG TPA: cytochrome c [Longimicrobiales bacterium]
MRDDDGPADVPGRQPGEGPGQQPRGPEMRGPGTSGFEDATSGHRRVPPDEVLAHEHALPEHGERDFEPDVERLHRPIYREPRDPIEGREPTPWWVWATAAAALFWGGWYLGQHGGTFSTATHIAYAERVPPVAAQVQAGQARAVADPIAAGQSVYQRNCQSCHQQNGRGIPGAFPPLVGSEWVTGPPETPIRIVLGGLQGPIEVAGQTYDGVMPAWGQLSDADIAAVISYIRQWEPNAAPAVSPEQVSAIRQQIAGRTTPWSAAELRAQEGGAP